MMNTVKFLLIILAASSFQTVAAQKYSQALVDKANAGDANAQNELALCYAKGDGVAKDMAKAIALLNKAADAGNVYAMCNLAGYYEAGNGVPKDSVMAFNLCLNAAQKGNSWAQQHVGWYYYYGKAGVKKDYVESLKWFEKSSKPYAYYMKGWQYEYGQGAIKDLDKAAKAYRAALPDYEDAFKHLNALAENGNVEAMFQLGAYYRRSLFRNSEEAEKAAKERSKSHPWLEKAASLGHGEAAFDLGSDYYFGNNGTEQSYAEAYKWFKKGESLNNVSSMKWLASMLLEGEAPERNDEEVVRLCNKGIAILEKQAKEENRDEVYSSLFSILGDCYLDGLGGLPKDEKKAFELYSKCDDPKSMSNRGYCYRYGVGTQKDYKKAFMCYERAAEDGGYYHVWHLAQIYEEGVIIPKDTKKAFEYYQDLADEEMAFYTPEARNDLARCYLNGIGTAKDEAKAFHWYQLSADDKDEDGECGVGVCYYNGYGVTKDYNKAFQWFNKTIDDHPVIRKSTYVTVLEYLSKCYRFGRGVKADPKKADECLEKAQSLGSTSAEDIKKGNQRMKRLTR